MKIIHTHDRAHEVWALMLIAVLLLVGFTAIIIAGLVEAIPFALRMLALALAALFAVWALGHLLGHL